MRLIIRTLGVPNHKLFFPLDLLERKNIPRVVYCLHELAAVVHTKYGIGKRITDRTGSFKFGDEVRNRF